MSRLDTNNDGYFDSEERRHLSEAMRDAERDRPRGGYDDDDPIEFFMKFFIIGAIIIAVLLGAAFFGAEQLDSWFGWELTKWLEENIPFGNPFK